MIKSTYVLYWLAANGGEWGGRGESREGRSREGRSRVGEGGEQGRERSGGWVGGGIDEGGG